MAYEKQEARWRQWLTVEEAARIAEIDAADGAAKEAAAARRYERALIANRAIQRARHADRKAKP